MGKRIITQRRGKGSTTYRSHSFKHKGRNHHKHYTKEEKEGVSYGKVVDIIHCRGHSAPLAVVKFDKEEILTSAPVGIYKDQIVASGLGSPIAEGNTMPLKNIPTGTNIFNIESFPGDGGKFIRAAGTTAKIVAKSENDITIEFPSKKLRKFNPECRAIIGIISGGGRKDKPFVKAGKRHHAMRAKSKLYPKTSGVAMNAVDHPFGSGRGRHVGKPKTPSRFAPPGRNIGLLRARRTGKKK